MKGHWQWSSGGNETKSSMGRMRTSWRLHFTTVHVFYSSNSYARMFLVNFLCVICLLGVTNGAMLPAVEWWLCVVPSSLNFLLQLMFLFPFLDSILIFNYGSVIVPVGKHLWVLPICSFVVSDSLWTVLYLVDIEFSSCLLMIFYPEGNTRIRNFSGLITYGNLDDISFVNTVLLDS